MAIRKRSIVLWATGLGLVLCGTAFAASFAGLEYLPGGESSSLCGAVSANGSVVVGWSGYEAFRWTDGEGMQGLGDLPGGDFRSLAGVVSADGSVVAGTSQSTGSFATEAFRWTDGEGMQGLGMLPGGRYSEALAVSADGSVVVGTSQSAAGYEAFRWTADEGMVALGGLPGEASAGSAAYGVSADGSMVVGQSRSSAGYEAFRWTAGEGMQGLGDLPGADWSRARGVSPDGSVVVGSSGAAGSGGEAFVWDSVRGMRSLRNVLAGERGLELDGWNLEEATGISADGLTIAGNGTNPAGRPEAWIVRLDAPRDRAVGGLPSGFALEGNYPNPFNPGTSIRFVLPEAAVVRLVVYDLQGQEVVTLIDRQRYTAGRHAVPFESAELASGVYLCRFEAGRFWQVEKMTLLK